MQDGERRNYEGIMSHVTDIILVTAIKDGAVHEDTHPNADMLDARRSTSCA